MPNQILEGIAQDIKGVEAALADAKDLVSAMKEAGETEAVAKWETEIRSLEIRKVKWERMLQGRGIVAK